MFNLDAVHTPPTGALRPPAQIKHFSQWPNANAPAWTRTLRPGAKAQTTLDSLGKRLLSVQSKLELIAGERCAMSDTPLAPERIKRARASVMECAQELASLHAALNHEIGQRWQLELDIFDTQMGLAQSQTDLSVAQADAKRARHQALHDELTGLPSRLHFCERLNHALGHMGTQHEGLAVLCIDLDDFKAINDAHGHATGDALLRIVAARLVRVLRAGDMVSRLGGNEFACLPKGALNRAHLSQLACKLYDAVAAPLMIGEVQLTVSASIGIALCPTDGFTADALINSANNAMQHAKRKLCGFSFFSTSPSPQRELT